MQLLTSSNSLGFTHLLTCDYSAPVCLSVCLQIQLNRFPANFQQTFSETFSRFLCCHSLINNITTTSNVWTISNWACDDELRPTLITVPSNQLTKKTVLHKQQYVNHKYNIITVCRYSRHKKIFQENQLNFRRCPVFPGGISNSSRFPVFPGAVDTLCLSVCLSMSISLEALQWVSV